MNAMKMKRTRQVVPRPKIQKALVRWKAPESYRFVLEGLESAGRDDLLARFNDGQKQLVRSTLVQLAPVLDCVDHYLRTLSGRRRGR